MGIKENYMTFVKLGQELPLAILVSLAVAKFNRFQRKRESNP